MKIDWKPTESATTPPNALISTGGRFLITRDPGSHWLHDLASNHPPNPPKRFATEDDAQRYAEGMIDRGERL
jgi:hypothetical protein